MPWHDMMTMIYLVLTTRHAALATLTGVNIIFDTIEALHPTVLVINAIDRAIIEFHKREPVDLQTPVSDMNQTLHLLSPVQMRSHKLHRRRCQPTLRAFAVLESGFRVDDVFHRNDLIATRKLATAIRFDFVIGLPEFVGAALATLTFTLPRCPAVVCPFAHEFRHILSAVLDFSEQIDFIISHVDQSLPNIRVARVG